MCVSIYIWRLQTDQQLMKNSSDFITKLLLEKTEDTEENSYNLDRDEKKNNVWVKNEE